MGSENTDYPKFLYGAAVQGIQGLIFRTNKLKEIIGTSALIEKVCTKAFEEFGEDGKNGKSVVQAAGNVKFIFDKREDCEKAVLKFPRKVTEMAPGIEFSQSVVELKGGDPKKFEEATLLLEKNLRGQRNAPLRNTNIGLMGVRRSRRTGFPAVEYNEKEKDFLDRIQVSALEEIENEGKGSGTLAEKSFGQKFPASKLAFDTKDMTGQNDWIAIIHADGNGLGQIIQKIGSKPDQLSEFSMKLSEATEKAARLAFKDVCPEYASDRAANTDGTSNRTADDRDQRTPKRIPFRPIVLSGDDHTMICRASLAVDYTRSFIKHFEEQTKDSLGEIIRSNNVFTEGAKKDCLTACAGIAFIKSSYPFYYGYQLAEALCDQAKKDAKRKQSVKDGQEIAPSCLMFYKVQDSFVSSYKEMAKRELEVTAGTFEFGPYYIDNESDGRWAIADLLEKVKALGEDADGNALRANLRQWIELMHDDPGKAAQRLERVKSLLKGKSSKIANDLTMGRKYQGQPEGAASEGGNERVAYPTYDALTLHTIITQETDR